MNKLIFSSFIFKHDYQTSPQLGVGKKTNTKDIYLKNIFVALKSAQVFNPESDVALVTNIELPIYYERLFNESEIKVYLCNHDSFIFPKNFRWALAFYKLNSLKFIIENTGYNKIISLDSDTITLRNYNILWEEIDYGLLLYNIQHSYNHKVRQEMRDLYKEIYKENINVIQYGGEFIAGTRDELKVFVEKLENIYKLLKAKELSIPKDIGDELLISFAAMQTSHIYDASPYISRYWTGKYYHVSTNYYFDPVCIWHLPSEKKYGILNIFSFLIKDENILKNQDKLAKMVGLPSHKRSMKNITNFKWYLKKIIEKIDL